jgi:hypothetical protein
MRNEPIIHELGQVSDETLYARLAMLRQRLPQDYRALDYEYRRDAWETANKAVQAEIRRRKAAPPAWWPQRPSVKVSQLRFEVIIVSLLVVFTVIFAFSFYWGF